MNAETASTGRTGRTGRTVVLGAIRVYRAAISPMHPPTCRYVPTCSEFALVAVERFGVARGGWLALRRLLRCHPLHAGGYDPVPDVRARATRTA